MIYQDDPACVPHPDNPVFSKPKPHCIAYWKTLARDAIESVEWARSLLCSATPTKVLTPAQEIEWCDGFGKWFADSHKFPATAKLTS